MKNQTVGAGLRPDPTNLETLPQVANENQLDDLTRLTTLLHHASGGTWTLALYENAIIQKQIIARLRAALAPLPVLEERLSSDRADPLPILRALPIDDHGPPVVCLTGVEEAFPALFGYLDLERELLALMPHRLILWVTEYGWRQLAEHAPNFYSRLSGVFRFPGRVSSAGLRTEAQHVPDRIMLATGLHLRPPIPVQDERDREQRIALLQRRVAELSAMSRPDPAAIAGSYYDLGVLHEGAYRWEEARRAYEDAAQWYAKAGQVMARAGALFQVGRACYYSDRWSEAEAALTEALTLYRLVGDRLGEANVYLSMGRLLLSTGLEQEGVALLEQAAALYQAIKDGIGIANVHIALGQLAAARGDLQAAIAHFQPAADFARAIGHPLGDQLQAQIDEWKKLGGES
ncbi:MAG: tetratricopeptide repeat protein [Anaerolineae bacterium]|nr:tetratricopeptide repeat protein [Anaerolineae bacterium]